MTMLRAYLYRYKDAYTLVKIKGITVTYFKDGRHCSVYFTCLKRKPSIVIQFLLLDRFISLSESAKNVTHSFNVLLLSRYPIENISNSSREQKEKISYTVPILE